MLISENAINLFKKREQAVLKLLQDNLQNYEEIGVFGSYARGDCTVKSDIDFYVIGEKPEPKKSGWIREEADANCADVVFVTREFLEHGDTKFIQNLRKERICLYERK